MTFYVQPHRSQYEAGASTITRRSGCTWTSGVNGIAAVSGGRYQPTPDQLHDLLRSSDEQFPATPGWSLKDLVRATARYGVTLTEHTGEGWYAVLTALATDHYVVLQGDSDQFGNATCSGSFDGDHAIGVHPWSKVVDGERWRWIDDPICPTGRWEREAVLGRYAAKFWSAIRFAVFFQPVPQVRVAEPAPGGHNVAIRYATANATTTMALAKGQALYERPGGDVVTHMSAAAKVPHVGKAGSVNGKPWRAVVVATRWSYGDGLAHRTVLYVPASAGKVS
jgi:hypothetical protein